MLANLAQLAINLVFVYLGQLAINLFSSLDEIAYLLSYVITFTIILLMQIHAGMC